MSFDKIKEVITKNRVIISNFSYLSVLQVLNLLVPLLVYPYLIKVLGSEIFGVVIFAQAIMSYFVILVSFGFNISGAKSISIHRDDNKELSSVFSSIFFIKLALFVFSIFVLIILSFYIPHIRDYKILFFLTFWMCLYDIMFPIWYFQGIEKMKYITYITLVMRVIFLILIFLLVKEPSDYLKVPIINGIGSIIAGSIAIYIIVYKHKIKLFIPSYDVLKNQIKDSFSIFVSNISIQLYVATNKVIVGSFLGMTSVAYYDLAEKILTVLRIPQMILSQTVFPKISKEKNIFFIKKIFKISIIINSLLCVGAFVLAPYMVEIIGGDSLIGAIFVLRILLITIPVIGMSNIFGIQVLIPFGFHKDFSKGIVYSGIFYFLSILTIWFFFSFTIGNIAYTTVVTEIFVTVFLFYLCKKNKLW